MSRAAGSQHESTEQVPNDGCEALAREPWARSTAIWYLSGVVFALGFSLGLTLAPPKSRPRNSALDVFAWQDGRWYRQIADNGYDYKPDERSNAAFFPVYPLLARGVASVLNLRVEIALLVVSNSSLLGALLILRSYARLRYPTLSESGCDHVLLAASFFPTACFFRMAYSESTFLLASVTAFYAIERRWPLWLTAPIVGLGTAVRPVGIALLAPLVIGIWRRDFSVKKKLKLIVFSSPVACWGLAAFMAFQYAAFGEPLAFAKAQQHWGVRSAGAFAEKLVSLATLEPVLAVYSESSPTFWGLADNGAAEWFSLQFANPLYFVTAIALIAFGAHRRWLAADETLLAVLLLLIPYATRGYEMGMGSMGRFVAVVFPIYLVAGQLLGRAPAAITAALISLSAFMMGAYAAFYAAGRLVF
ncbi:MAG TPA: hypothetical protein VMV10_09455 [Pirellulales bacterium]|nr:hypothetical protein [Pirellulales bacterium]